MSARRGAQAALIISADTSVGYSDSSGSSGRGFAAKRHGHSAVDNPVGSPAVAHFAECPTANVFVRAGGAIPGWLDAV